jgi:hypothetical protein
VLQQSQVEAEEEFITNKLMKRLEQLRQEKQTLANEVRYTSTRFCQQHLPLRDLC